MARPCVHFIASSKVHSDLDDGFDKGIIIGFLLKSAILFNIDSLKTPRCVDKPIRIVGCT